MEISSFDDLLSAARQQEQPQRLLFVFTEAELDPDSTEAQRRDFEAGHGGALVPVLTADKSPDELAGFATMVQESQLIVALGPCVEDFVVRLFGIQAAAARLAQAHADLAPLYVVSEWPSWYWDDDDALHPRDELVRIRSTPCDEATPLEVIGVCLPFVLVETPQRDGKTLDVRRVRLARLDRTFAKRTRRALRRREKREQAEAKK